MTAATPSLPREVFVRELEVGSWATFDPTYGPEKVLSIDRFVLTKPVDGFAQYGVGVEVLHLQVGSRFITRSAYETVLEIRRSVQVTLAEAEAALRAKAAGTSNPAYQRHLLKFLRLFGLGAVVIVERLRRRWRCFREGHRWHLDPIIPGPNYCERCGRLVEW
jgi:hypothetical protein